MIAVLQILLSGEQQP